jgi:hypothetical protein
MKTVPPLFTKSDWTHQMLSRIGQIAIYRRAKEVSPAPHYEVVVIEPYQAGVVMGREIEAGESYPSAAQWGTKGWTYRSLEMAQAKFRELTAPKGPKKLKKPQPK